MGKVAGAMAKKAKAGKSGGSMNASSKYIASKYGAKGFGKPKAAAATAMSKPSPRNMKRRYPTRMA